MDQQRDAGGYTPGQIRALKIAIGTMTAAIVLGLAVLVLTFAYRTAGGKRPGGSSVAKALDLKALYPASGAIAEAKIPAGARLASVTPAGDRLILTVDDGGGAILLSLDPKTGKIEALARLQQAPW